MSTTFGSGVFSVLLDKFKQTWSLQDVEIQERVYTADKPRQDRLMRREYSIDRLIKQAAR